MPPLRSLALTAAIILCAAQARGTVGESPVFNTDTRDDFTRLAAESGTFAFDTRFVDGLSDDANSGTFVLDTRLASLSALTVNGPAVVSPAGTALFTATLQVTGGGTQNVTTASAWSYGGTVPPGTLIGAGQLLVGSGSTGGTFVVRAYYQSPAGRITGEKVVSVGGSIKPVISHTLQSLGGNNYQVQLSGSALGAVGAHAFHWTTTSGGVFSNPQAQNPTLSLSSTGGRCEVTLELTDSASAYGIARQAIFIDKPAVPNQPGKLAPASDGSQGAFLSMSGNPFQFDPARVANGLIVLTHGLESSGSEEWIQNLAATISAEIPAAQRPNIMIYDWETDANPNRVSLPFGSGIGVKVAAKLGWLTKPVAAALSDALIIEKVTDLAGIRPMGQTHGVILGQMLLREEVSSPSRIDFSKPVHFVGHSAGGFVVGEAAWVLRQKGKTVDRVTMLDTPYPFEHHLTQLPNPTVVERYVSSIIGAVEWPGTKVLDDTDYRWMQGVYFDSLWSFAKALTPLAHKDAHEWYRYTVYPDPGYEYMGFYFSPFKNGPVAPRPPAAGFRLAMASFAGKDSEVAAEASVTDFQVFGNAALSYGVWTLTENSDAGIFTAMTLPPDAVKLQFKYRWSGTGDGDFLGVRFGARPELFVGPDLEISRDDFLPAEVEIGTLAGLSDDLVFTLVSRGAPGAILELKDIVIVQDDDADGDGLTTAQEQAIGTHCQNPDTDGDSIDDLAELNALPPTNPIAADTDSDGSQDADEIQAGTDPTNGQSYLRVTDTVRHPGGNFQLRWPSTAGRFYNVQRSTDVSFGTYEVIGQGVSATPPKNTFIDNSSGTAQRMFYRIEVYQP